ncbi:hypothetical protein Droror1_Dr00021580 [Drosera rotundifolia]
MTATTKSNGALTYVYLLVYIALSSGQIFFNKEGDAFDYKNDSDEPTASIVPRHEKYISKSYFKEHERLQYSSFQDYIVRVLEGNPERVHAELLDLHHNLVGEGSHRHLSSYLRYSIEPDSISDPSGQQCEIIFIERLPSGVFADPFEYQHLIRRGVFKDAAVFGDTNLELPSFLSSRSMVEVHIEVDSNITSGQKFSWEVKVELPVHARYPPVGNDGYSRIEFGKPDLLLRCGTEGSECSSQNCSLSCITGGADPGQNAVSWSIPAGIETHAKVVSAVTFASALLSAALIIVVSLRQSSVGGKNFKQS